MKKKFPRYLSSPLQVLWFESDEIAVIFLSLLLILMYESLLLWLLLFVIPYAYTKVKKKYPRGFIRHFLYFLGLIEMKGYPSFFESDFLE